MRDWDDEIYQEDKEIAERKASGLCTICKWKIETNFVDGEWVETVISHPLKATKKYMFMDLCDKHYEETIKTVKSICE